MNYIQTFEPTFYDEMVRYNYETATYGDKQEEDNIKQQAEDASTDAITHLFKTMKDREAAKEQEQDKEPTATEVTETIETDEGKEEATEENPKKNETPEPLKTSTTPEPPQEEQHTPVEKEEIKQQEKTVQKRKMDVTPLKDGKKQNKDKSPGTKKKAGQKQPAQKTADEQNIPAKRSLEEKLSRQKYREYVDNKLRESRNERNRSENTKPPSNPDRSRSPSIDRRPDWEDLG